MNRDELLALRKHLIEAVNDRKALGEYDTNAAPILTALESCLALTQHLLERLRK